MKKLLMAAITLLMVATEANAGTLDRVKEDGLLRCGVRDLGAALSYINDDGRWAGFYPEICRAVASAVLGDADSVDFIVTSSDARFDELRDEEFDLLIESTTWTLSRDADGLDFLGLYLFDGQGFLTYKPAGYTKLAELKGKSVCIENHTTSIANLRDHSKENDLGFDIRPYNTMEGAFAAFFDRQCDAISTDVLVIASIRQLLAPNPADYDFLPERISKEPLAPVVRSGDDEWADVVQWVIYSLIAAEELGITKDNIETMKTSKSSEVRRLLGVEGDIGAKLGLDVDWAVRAIKQTGNFGELFDATLTKELGIKRGINDLWTRGGLIWAPPVR